MINRVLSVGCRSSKELLQAVEYYFDLSIDPLAFSKAVNDKCTFLETPEVISSSPFSKLKLSIFSITSLREVICCFLPFPTRHSSGKAPSVLLKSHRSICYRRKRNSTRLVWSCLGICTAIITRYSKKTTPCPVLYWWKSGRMCKSPCIRTW